MFEKDVSDEKFLGIKEAAAILPEGTIYLKQNNIEVLKTEIELSDEEVLEAIRLFGLEEEKKQARIDSDLRKQENKGSTFQYADFNEQATEYLLLTNLQGDLFGEGKPFSSRSELETYLSLKREDILTVINANIKESMALEETLNGI